MINELFCSDTDADHSLGQDARPTPQSVAKIMGAFNWRPGEENRYVAANTMALHIEDLLGQRDANNIKLGLTCWRLQKALDLKCSQLALLLAATYPEQIASTSWTAKLLKAGELHSRWPELCDMLSIEKLATLHRIPKNLQADIFKTGRLPNGSAIRDLNRNDLASAVAKLLNPTASSSAEDPRRRLKKELVKLAGLFIPAIEQVALMPEYEAIASKLAAWQLELARMIQETPVFIPKPTRQTQSLAM